MNKYPLTLEEIVSWMRSKEHVLKDFGVTLAEVRQRSQHLPCAAANFDSTLAMGQICAWVSGEIDFQVLRASDGKDVFLHHETVADFRSPSLERAYSDFLYKMANPSGAAE